MRRIFLNMNYKLKVSLGILGLTVWIILVSLGVYRFNNHSGLDQQILVYECSSELVKNKGSDLSSHSWVYITKYGTKSFVTLEVPLTDPYVSGGSFTCVMDSNGLVQEVLDN